MAQKEETSAAKLRFLFKEKGFVLDQQEEIASEEILGWRQRFETARYQALYDLGFGEKPNWLDAAALYGIGARFDENPLLFFELRGVDVGRFIDVALENRVESMLANADKPSDRIIQDESWREWFGVI